MTLFLSTLPLAHELLAVISIGAGKKDNQRLKISPSLMPSLMPTKTYHLYITDTTPKQLSAEDVALLYRAREALIPTGCDIQR
jgi:hypothetical protein